jgi:voltage-gated potassium channel
MGRLIYNKFVLSAFLLVLITVVGTTGYWIIGEGRYSLVDCLYMTVITLTTIGFGEIVDMNGKPGGRLFTILIALSGIGTLSYIITNFTASIVEGDLSDSFRRRRMEKTVSGMSEHYIVCGYGRIGKQIANELASTKRPFVIVESDGAVIGGIPEDKRASPVIQGDATENEILQKAGIERARGVFCATNDDNQNLVISLTARQLNSKARIVARCEDLGKRDKIMITGANAVISPNFIGGLRMASEMVRPTVVSFLDIMLRDKDKNLRVEEVAIPPAKAGRTIGELHLKKRPAILLLAVKRSDGWVYNPQDDHAVAEGDRLIVMSTPEERQRLEQDLMEK